MKIAVISDNHSYFGSDIELAVSDVDQIWHAGDIGDKNSILSFESSKVFRGVYGNIDDQEIKSIFPLNNIFNCGGMKIFMTHIGGYPGKYTQRVSDILKIEKPDIYICGHSHICKVMPDKTRNLIHMNPGSYGHQGFHKFRTILKFNIEKSQIKNLHVVELGIRGRIT